MNALPNEELPGAATSDEKDIPFRQILWLALGFGLWFSALIVIYVLHSVGCAFGWPQGTIRLSVVLALVVHIALIGLLWRVQATRAPFGRKSAFLHWVIVATLIAALAKIVFSLGPVLFLTMCK